MRLDTAVREARTQILTLSAVRPDGRRTYDVSLRPLHEARGDREVEIMRDDLVRILFGAVSDDVEVVFGDSVRALSSQDPAPGWRSSSSTAPPGRSTSWSVPTATTPASANRYSARKPLTPTISARICRSTRSTMCSVCVTAQSSTTNPAAPQRCSRCAATNVPRWCCCFAVPARRRLRRRRRTSRPVAWAIRRDGMGDKPSPGGDPGCVRLLLRRNESGAAAAWSTGRTALLGDAAYGPSPMSGQGTSLALIGAYLLAGHLAQRRIRRRRSDCGSGRSGPMSSRIRTWPPTGCHPAARSRMGIFARNQSMRVLPLLARYGRGFGGRIERASRAVTLTD